MLTRRFRKLRARSFGRVLGRSEDGLAMTEFAFALPILLTLGLVGLEVAWLTLAHLKVSNIAMMTADNAARVRDGIDEGNVSELFTGARLAGAGMNFAPRGRIILYSIEPKTSGPAGQWIRWQRCFGSKVVVPTYGRPMNAGGTAITNGTEESAPSSGNSSTSTAYGPAGNQIAAQAGTAVNMAEVFYDYQPLLAGNLLGDITIRRTAAFNVRQRTNQVLTNRNGGARAACN